MVWIPGADDFDLFDQTTVAQDPLVSRVTGVTTTAYPARAEGFVSLLTTPVGYVIAIHQNQSLTKELATGLPHS